MTERGRGQQGARRRVVPRPERVRRLGPGVAFGWIDARFHREGWLEALTPSALAAYVFLCLAADREGVSFYRRDRIGRALGLDDDAEVARALRRLRDLDLVGYAPFSAHAVDGFHQVLSLPTGGPPASPLAATLCSGPSARRA